jgi:hypothetical protein
MSNAERLKQFFKSDGFNEIELLIQIMTLSYRKACRLKLLKYSRQKYASSIETSEEDNNPVVPNDSLNFSNILPRLPPGGGSDSSSTSTSEGTNDHHELENIINTNNENEVDVEIEDENRSVSDFMTTEDEDEPDDDEDVEEEGEAEEQHPPTNEDGDDEPILGKWFESVLSPPESDKTGDDSNINIKDRDDRKSTEKANDAVEILVEEFIRDKSCPHGVIIRIITYNFTVLLLERRRVIVKFMFEFPVY